MNEKTVGVTDKATPFRGLHRMNGNLKKHIAANNSRYSAFKRIRESFAIEDSRAYVHTMYLGVNRAHGSLGDRWISSACRMHRKQGNGLMSDRKNCTRCCIYGMLFSLINWLGSSGDAVQVSGHILYCFKKEHISQINGHEKPTAVCHLGFGHLGIDLMTMIRGNCDGVKWKL